MLIYVNKLFFIGRTDGRSTQNYSSEPHNTINLEKKSIYFCPEPSTSYFSDFSEK